MEWDVEYTDEFGSWWETLSEKEQTAVAVTVGLLEPAWDRGCRFRTAVPCMVPVTYAELRTQCDGHPLRTLYAFDPRRVLLIGGDKTGDDRWYEIFVPLADRLYDEHLKEIALNVSKRKGVHNDSRNFHPFARA